MTRKYIILYFMALNIMFKQYQFEEFDAYEYFCSMLYSIEQEQITQNIQNFIQTNKIEKKDVKIKEIKKYNYYLLQKCLKKIKLFNEKEVISKIQVLLSRNQSIGDINEYLKISDNEFKSKIFNDSLDVIEDNYVRKMQEKQIWNTEQKKSMQQMLKEQADKITIEKTLRILLREQSFLMRVGIIFGIIVIIVYIATLIYCCAATNVDEEFKHIIKELSETLEKKEVLEDDDERLKKKKKTNKPFKGYKQN